MKYTECYDIVTGIRMLRWETGNTAGRVAKAAKLLARAQFLDHYWGYPPTWRMMARKHLAGRLPGGNRVLPDFACVGSIKNGTSDLATNLFSHPSIVPPFSKEIFSDDVESWRPYYPTTREMNEARAATGAARTGYFTPWLSRRPLAAKFHDAAPDAKAILMLRDPVKRAYSHYKWELIFGGPRALKRPQFSSYASFVDAALELYPDYAPTYCGEPFLQCGMYANLVTPWLKTFGSDNVMIVRAEDYFTSPATILGEIHQFLGLEPIPYRKAPKLNENPLEAPVEEPESRAKLAEFYRPHNERLYELIGRDLRWT